MSNILLRPLGRFLSENGQYNDFFNNNRQGFNSNSQWKERDLILFL